MDDVVSCFLYCYTYHRDLHVRTHSVPTRRSSDLCQAGRAQFIRANCGQCGGCSLSCSFCSRAVEAGARPRRSPGHKPIFANALWGLNAPVYVIAACRTTISAEAVRRSEEHKSELQSLMRISYAVFCLKKKKQKLIQE